MAENFGGPVWHASGRGRTLRASKQIALDGLRGVGDEALGQWIDEQGAGRGIVHVQRRMTAIEGFDLCRSLSTREEFETVLRARQNRETEMHRAHYEKPEAEREDDVARYWRHRYGTLQVEWVLNCLIVAGWSRPGDMLSGRAAMKVAKVTGSSSSTR